MIAPVSIGSKKIADSAPVYIVAEISANHRGDFQNAVRLVEAAADAGADAVKVQTYTADTITLDGDQACFRVGGGTLWDGRSLHDLYSEASMPWEWQPELQRIARHRGLDFFSTPFDASAVEFLERLGVCAYKIASFEIVDLPLIRKVAATGKPLIISTGMASLTEIDEAVSVARDAGASEIVLLKCTSAYPAPPEQMNLRTIPALSARYNVPAGLSDHTLGIAVPVAAVALGAALIEKHITLLRSAGGPDAAFSLEPDEFRQMVASVRSAKLALGEVKFGPQGEEKSSLAFRRSLFLVRDVRRGDVLTPEHVRSIRPASGLHTRHLPEIIGLRATRDLSRGTPLSWDMVTK